MGGTQHTNGNNNTRAYCALQLALGNIGVAGGGANIFRGHDNVQGATDMCLLADSLPGYYGLAAGSWKHWARVWDVDYDWVKGRFASQKLMESKGIPVSRWIDGVLEKKENIDQPNNIRAMVYWGHAVNSQTRLPEMKKAMEKLDLMVVIDPVPTFASIIPDRKDGIYVLPATTQFETYGSVTASNRSLQWRDKVFKPWFESQARPRDHVPVRQEARLRQGAVQAHRGQEQRAGDRGHHPRIQQGHVDHRLYRPVAGAAEGAHGQPGQLRPDHADGQGRPVSTATTTACRGRAGAPPQMKHPGTPILYDTSKPVAEGGLTFRARFGVEHKGEKLLAEGSYSEGSELKDGYPEFTMAMLKKLGWDKDLTPTSLRPSRRWRSEETVLPARSPSGRRPTTTRRSAG